MSAPRKNADGPPLALRREDFAWHHGEGGVVGGVAAARAVSRLGESGMSVALVGCALLALGVTRRGVAI